MMVLTGPLAFSADRRIIHIDILGDYDEEEIGALFGAVAGVGTITGDMSLARLLQAAAAGLGVTTGQLSATAFLEALAQGIGTVSGMLTQDNVFRGVAAGVGTAAADLTASRALEGTAAGLGVAAGDLSALAMLQATAAGLGTTAGALTVEKLLQALAAGTGTATAILTAEALLQALAEGAGAAAGVLTLEGAFVFTFPAEDELANDAILDFDFINDQYQHDGVLYDDLTALAANPAIAWTNSRSTTKNVRSSGSDLPTTSVAANLPARDFLAGVARGLYLERSRTNVLFNTAAGADLATQTRTVSNATQYTLSFWGTGTITLTGASTAGPLVGTGANDRVKLTFTTSSTSLTLTVSGSCKYAQLETGAYPSSWISTAGAAATRGADTLTLGPVDKPAGSNLITNGLFDTNITGWTNLSTGGGTLAWNSGNGGQLRITGAATSNQGWAQQAITTVVGQLYRLQYWHSQTGFCMMRVGSTSGGVDLASSASTGIITLYFIATTTTTYINMWTDAGGGAIGDYDNIRVHALTNLVTNGDFATGDLTGWSNVSTGTGTIAYDAGTVRLTGGTTGNQAWAEQAVSVTAGRTYRFSFTKAVSTGAASARVGTTSKGGELVDSNGAGPFMFTPVVSTVYINVVTSQAGSSVTFDNLRLVEVVPFEGWTPDGTWILFLRGDDYNASTTTHRFLSVDDATNSNRWPGFWSTSGGAVINIARAGADQYQPTGVATFFNARKKISLAAQSNDARAYIDGTAISVQDTSITLPGVRQVHLGAGSNNADNCDGWIERFIYFPRRISDGQQGNITGVVWP